MKKRVKIRGYLLCCISILLWMVTPLEAASSETTGTQESSSSLSTLDTIPYAEYYQQNEENFCERIKLNPELVKDFDYELCLTVEPLLKQMYLPLTPLNSMYLSDNPTVQEMERKQLYRVAFDMYAASPIGSDLSGADNLWYINLNVAKFFTYVCTIIPLSLYKLNMRGITFTNGTLLTRFFDFFSDILFVKVLQFDKGLDGLGATIFIMMGIVLFLITILQRIFRPDWKKALSILFNYFLAAVVISTFALRAQDLNKILDKSADAFTSMVLSTFRGTEGTTNIEIEQKNMIVKIGAEFPFLFRNFGATSVETIPEYPSQACKNLWGGNVPSKVHRKYIVLTADSYKKAREGVFKEAGKEDGWWNNTEICNQFIPNKSNVGAEGNRLGVASSILLPQLSLGLIFLFLIFINLLAMLVLKSRFITSVWYATKEGIKAGKNTQAVQPVFKAVWKAIVQSFIWIFAMKLIMVAIVFVMFGFSLTIIWIYSQGMLAVWAFAIGSIIGLFLVIRNFKTILKVVKKTIGTVMKIAKDGITKSDVSFKESVTTHGKELSNTIQEVRGEVKAKLDDTKNQLSNTGSKMKQQMGSRFFKRRRATNNYQDAIQDEVQSLVEKQAFETDLLENKGQWHEAMENLPKLSQELPPKEQKRVRKQLAQFQVDSDSSFETIEKAIQTNRTLEQRDKDELLEQVKIDRKELEKRLRQEKIMPRVISDADLKERAEHEVLFTQDASEIEKYIKRSKNTEQLRERLADAKCHLADEKQRILEQDNVSVDVKRELLKDIEEREQKLSQQEPQYKTELMKQALQKEVEASESTTQRQQEKQQINRKGQTIDMDDTEEHVKTGVSKKAGRRKRR